MSCGGLETCKAAQSMSFDLLLTRLMPSPDDARLISDDEAVKFVAMYINRQ